MSTFTVAMLQLQSHGTDTSANQATGMQACRDAAALGADLALFPEMWSIGYTFCPDEPAEAERWRELAVATDSRFVRRHRELARELDMAIAITYLESHEPAPRNVVSVIDRNGDIVLHYAKVHTCDFGMEAALTPGESFGVAKLNTKHGDVEIGSMICYDREFPESARVLMLQGAEVILVPNACDLEINRIAQTRSRAFENMVGIAVANYPAPQCNGHSVAFDGMAFGDKPRDMLISEADEGEQIVLAQFDMDALRKYREYETWGDAYRKPGAYAGLVRGAVHPTFGRQDSRRSHDKR